MFNAKRQKVLITVNVILFIVSGWLLATNAQNNNLGVAWIILPFALLFGSMAYRQIEILNKNK